MEIELNIAHKIYYPQKIFELKKISFYRSFTVHVPDYLSKRFNRNFKDVVFFTRLVPIKFYYTQFLWWFYEFPISTIKQLDSVIATQRVLFSTRKTSRNKCGFYFCFSKITTLVRLGYNSPAQDLALKLHRNLNDN